MEKRLVLHAVVALGFATGLAAGQSSCTVTPFGRKCEGGGPELAGTFLKDRRLELRLRAAPPNTLTVRMLGTHKLGWRIPSTPCWLNSGFAIVVPFVTDARGESTVRWPVPRSFQLTFLVQDILFEARQARTVIWSTNGLEVRCR